MIYMIEEKVTERLSYDMMIEKKEEEVDGIRWGIPVVINFFGLFTCRAM